MNPHSFSQTPGLPRKKGFGCFINTLIGLAALGIAIVVGSWLLIMHSPLPLRFVANLIEEGGEDSNLKLTGVSGSLASGLGFKKVEWNDGEITDLRFRYSGIMDVIRRKELVIFEMHVGSATIDRTFLTDLQDETQAGASPDPPAETGTTADPPPAAESTDDRPADTDPPLRLVRIDRVSLNNITIKSGSTGDTISIPKIEWIGFKAEMGAELQLGDLEADSDHLVIKTSNPQVAGYQKRLEITLMPKLDARILKPVDIDAYVGEQDGKMVFDIKALAETLTYTMGADGIQHIRSSGANLADFIDGPLPNKLHLEAEIADPTLTVRGGTFLLGTKSFEIQPTTSSGPDKSPEGTVFLALHRDGDTEIRYEIPATESMDEEQSFTPVLTRIPAMSSEDLMALLFHDRAFSELPPPEQERLRKHMSWFTFSDLE